MTEMGSKGDTTCDWTVPGMDRGSCAATIKEAVARLPGVSGIEVGIMSERLRLTLDETRTGRDKVEKTVRALGCGIAARAAGAKKGFVLPGEIVGRDHGDDHAGPDHGAEAATAAKRADSGHGSPDQVHDDPIERGRRWYQTGKGRLVIFTALLLGGAWGGGGTDRAADRQRGFVAACLIGIAPRVRRAFSALRMRQAFTIESLMTIAALGALIINAAEEVALVVFLFAVGAVLEGVAAGKARDGIRALAGLVPETALLEVNGAIRDVPAANRNCQVPDEIIQNPAERGQKTATISHKIN